MIKVLKSILRKVLPEYTLGMIDFYRFPQWHSDRYGPFNDQIGRLNIINQLVEVYHPQYIIETGTYRGSTTAHLSRSTGLPVFSIEANRRTYGFSKTRLKADPNIHLSCGDSRLELQNIAEQNHLERQRGLVYLDAHWGEELPLLDELNFVFTKLPDSIVVIDDFQVPYDAGYGYDDYGSGQALTLAYLAPILNSFDILPFFPVCAAEEETGARRGCCILSAKSEIRRLLDSSFLIRPYSG
ncbi:MAG: hypothetical protein ACR2QW_19470 [bacterium]